MKTARYLAFGSLALSMLFLAGCKPDWPQCKNDDHCAERDGEVVNYVCVEGTCVECAVDGDCRDGFICRDNACVPEPECATDTDCSGNLVCRAEKCVPECMSDAECGADMRCEQQRCVPDVECTADGDCASGEMCSPEGECVPDTRCTLEPVYFDFDESNLTSEARTTLEDNAQCLQTKQGQVTLAGHADERGTIEYNLALGERRANSVKKYLNNLGVQSDRLKTTSYGEERPVCEAKTEDCYQRNRRVELDVAPGM
jgi:peptidoglycan-associated lipoprotein